MAVSGSGKVDPDSEILAGSYKSSSQPESSEPGRGGWHPLVEVAGTPISGTPSAGTPISGPIQELGTCSCRRGAPSLPWLIPHAFRQGRSADPRVASELSLEAGSPVFLAAIPTDLVVERGWASEGVALESAVFEFAGYEPAAPEGGTVERAAHEPRPESQGFVEERVVPLAVAKSTVEKTGRYRGSELKLEIADSLERAKAKDMISRVRLRPVAVRLGQQLLLDQKILHGILSVSLGAASRCKRACVSARSMAPIRRRLFITRCHRALSSYGIPGATAANPRISFHRNSEKRPTFEGLSVLPSEKSQHIGSGSSVGT